MPDSSSKGSSFPQLPPLSTIMPVVTLVASLVVLSWERLDSQRPPSPGVAPERQNSLQDISARLWQDPLSLAQASKEPALGGQQKAGADAPGSPNPAAAFMPAGGKVTILPVIMLGGSYGQDVEFRARTRFAVWMGLWTQGWVPLDSDHIGALEWKSDAGSRIAAFEWGVQTKGGDERVLVVWVSENALVSKEKPMWNLAELLEQGSAPAQIKATEVKKKCVILAGGSSTLRAIASEAYQPESGSLLHGASVTIATATADDATVLKGQKNESGQFASAGILTTTNSPASALLKRLNANAGGSLTYRRSIGTDSVLMEALVGELAARDFFIKKLKEGARPTNQTTGRVVIITEMDTSYGRSLPVSFANAATESGKARPEQGALQAYATLHALVPTENKTLPWLDVRTYPRGIDGRLHGDAQGAGGGASKEADKKKEGASLLLDRPGEATEGLNQADYLRRLAVEIEAEDNLLRARDTLTGGVRAVGIVGTDVYDKLMILKALRPRLPQTIFFTTDLDARLANPDDWKTTRNLLIAAPYGLQADVDVEHPSHVGIAPFRDSYQTAVFAGVTGALSDCNAPLPPPQLFEMGRHGPVWLDVRTASAKSGVACELDSVAGVMPSVARSSAELYAARGAWWLAWLLIAIVSGHLLWVMSHAPDGVVGGGHVTRMLRAGLHSTAMSVAVSILLALAVSAIVIGVCSRCSQRPEPFAISDGISTWPTFAIRLAGIFIGWHFVFKAGLLLDSNREDIQSRFFPGLKLENTSTPADGQRGFWKRFVKAFEWMDGRPGNPIPLDAWSHYWRGSLPAMRRRRLIVLVLLYVASQLCIALWLGPPAIPARGAFAFCCDLVSLWLWIGTLVIVSMIVLDAFLQMVALIKHFDRGASDWSSVLTLPKTIAPDQPPETLTRSKVLAAAGVDPLHEDSAAAELLDIRLMASRTREVGRLFVYPFVVQVIGIAARSSLIDNWTWPVSLIIIISLNVLVAAFSLWRVTRVAWRARDASLARLRELRLIEPDAAKRKALDEAIASVRDETEGAFAPISQQPAVRYALWLMSGLGAGSIFGFFYKW